MNPTNAPVGDGSANHLAETTTELHSIDQPADPTLTAHPVTVGPFRIVRVPGEGGMGLVYDAEQDSPKRRAAHEAIRPGRVSRAVSRRFEHEVAVLGRLEHPAVAHIYASRTAEAPVKASSPTLQWSWSTVAPWSPTPTSTT